MAKHYTAVLEVQFTDRVPEKKDRYGNIEQHGKYEAGNVAKFEVRADNLQSLRERVAAHVALIEED